MKDVNGLVEQEAGSSTAPDGAGRYNELSTMIRRCRTTRSQRNGPSGEAFLASPQAVLAGGFGRNPEAELSLGAANVAAAGAATTWCRLQVEKVVRGRQLAQAGRVWERFHRAVMVTGSRPRTTGSFVIGIEV